MSTPSFWDVIASGQGGQFPVIPEPVEIVYPPGYLGPGNGDLVDGWWSPYGIVDVPDDNPQGWTFGNYSLCCIGLPVSAALQLIQAKSIKVTYNGTTETIPWSYETIWQLFFGNGFDDAGDSLGYTLAGNGSFGGGDGFVGIMSEPAVPGGYDQTSMPAPFAFYYYQGLVWLPLGVFYAPGGDDGGDGGGDGGDDGGGFATSFETGSIHHDDEGMETVGTLTVMGQTAILFGRDVTADITIGPGDPLDDGT